MSMNYSMSNDHLECGVRQTFVLDLKCMDREIIHLQSMNHLKSMDQRISGHFLSINLLMSMDQLELGI